MHAHAHVPDPHSSAGPDSPAAASVPAPAPVSATAADVPLSTTADLSAASLGAPTHHRLHALDNLRAIVMLTGITQHAALSYVVSIDFWPVYDVSRSFGFNILVGITNGFRSHLFFILAGFFARLLWLRAGLTGFIRNRAERIGLPFVLGTLTLVPLSGLIRLWATHQLPLAPGQWTTLFTRSEHFWFLEMLLIICALAALILRAAPRIPLAQRSLRPLDAAFDWLLARPWRIVALVPVGMLLMWAHQNVGLVHHKGHDLTPPPRAVLYYGHFFLLGCWLHRRSHHLQTLAQSYLSYLLLAVLSFPVFGIGYMIYHTPGHAQPLWLKTLVIAASALYAWAAAFALIGFFIRHVHSHTPRIRYLADASYWCYIAHFPLVLWLQILMLPWEVNCWVKFTLNVLLNLLILLPVYDLCVRYTWLGRILNGPRTRPAKHSPQSTHTTIT
ncbi:acyltransferase family protein [Prosthecobacter sp.]|uniref:acyltransferase family protein n=1 Tax=Prosthecobacter sp. TaxID=1965333 RepID=UPI0037850E18